jgi:hypothetical protein
MPSSDLQRRQWMPWQWRREKEDARSSRSIATVLWGALLCLGVAELVLITIQGVHGANDFCQDYASAVSLLHGQTAYPPVFCFSTASKLPGGIAYNSHPPTSIVLFLPFGLLSKPAATILWGLISLAAYLVSIWLLLRALRWPVLPGLALVSAGSILWLPAATVTWVLNTEQVLLLLLVGVWLLAERKRDSWAGVLLGIACLLKIWPVLLLVLPLLQRRWRLVLVTGGVIVAGILLALVVEGPSAFLAYAGPVRLAENAWVTIGYPGNISLTGALVGLLAGYSGATSRQAPAFPGMHAPTVVLLGEALSALLLLGGIGLVWWQRRVLQDRQDASGYRLAFGLLVTLSVVTFPLSWVWALITLLLPVATLLLALRRQPPLPKWWWWLLAASMFLMNVELVVFLGFIHLQRLATLQAVTPTVGLLLFVAAQATLLAWQPGRRPRAANQSYMSYRPVTAPELEEPETFLTGGV